LFVFFFPFFSSVLLSISSLLAEPNPDSALRYDVG